MSATAHRIFKRCRLSFFSAAIGTALLSLAFPAYSIDQKEAKMLINRADKALWKMNYAQADSLYTLALRDKQGSAELYWKLARLHISQSETIPDKKNEARQTHYRKAEEFARSSISIDSTNSKGHTWLAASLGMMADNAGTKEKLRRAVKIKQELDAALRLNPNDETALSMLGSYYREAANIGWFKRMMGNAFLGEVPKGSYELAEKAFRKAISIDPRVIRNYHELALICLKTNREQEAISLMKTALTQPVLIESDKARLEKMRKLLKEHDTENVTQ